MACGGPERLKGVPADVRRSIVIVGPTVPPSLQTTRRRRPLATFDSNGNFR
jgi:hypothetical protein